MSNVNWASDFIFSASDPSLYKLGLIAELLNKAMVRINLKIQIKHPSYSMNGVCVYSLQIVCLKKCSRTCVLKLSNGQWSMAYACNPTCLGG
jgi:hypothetical protein